MHLTDHAEDFAKEFAGNWTRFESFGWSSDSQPDDAEDNWGIYNSTHRDAGIRTQSNHAVIEKELASFPDDVIPMHMGHWAFGWMDGFAVRVRKNDGSFTEAFLTLTDCHNTLKEYPVLDDADHSQREYDATLDYIAGYYSHDLRDDRPDDWVHQVWQWIWDSDHEVAFESSGVYIEDGVIDEALRELGFLEEDGDDDTTT